MDWAGAIQRNSEALKGIIADLFAMLGPADDALVSRIPRSVHSAVLRLLRPTESAVRRLIVIAARGLVVKLKPVASRPMPKLAGAIGKGVPSRPSFQLFDQRKNFARRRRGRRVVPRIHIFGNTDPTVAALWAAPGPAYGALAGEAGEHAKSEVQVAAQTGSSSRPPEEAQSPNRQGAYRVPLACMGCDEARHKLKRIQIKTVRLRTNMVRLPSLPSETAQPFSPSGEALPNAD